jgi:hypothetical protein
MKDIKIKLDNGKYEVTVGMNGEAKATRYGEQWRDLTGDNLILFMAMKIEEQEEIIKEAKNCLARAATTPIEETIIDTFQTTYQILGGDLNEEKN